MKLFLTSMFFIFLSIAIANTPDKYIELYKDIAISEMEKSYIPASIILAQGMLESDFGRGELAIQANNHFGMKCGLGWSGKTYKKNDDDKDKYGNIIKSCFRAYGSVDDSYVAHSLFLSDPKKDYRYGYLFEYDTDDYVAWAVGLKDAGYATDPLYSNKLIAMIENYELFKYDKKINKINAYSTINISVPEKDRPIYKKKEKKKKSKNNKVFTARKTPARILNGVDLDLLKNTRKTIKNRFNKKKELPQESTDFVSTKNAKLSKRHGLYCGKLKKGETTEAFSLRYGIHVQRLISYNRGIQPSTIHKKGDVLYLEPKNNKYLGDKKCHIVKKGETMYTIAQKYGIKRSLLFKKNRIPENAEPLVGEKVQFKYINLFSIPKYKVNIQEEEFLFD